ncbi:MAG: CYTH domain-containing protein, partial [Saprospiraceae bacterium]|nr:CYTH domain-containing protein [Saprospiraceae bacterium]
MSPTFLYHEVELKYAIPSTRKKELVAFLRALPAEDELKLIQTREAVHEDLYFDSAEFDLVRHYCALRIRKDDAKGKTLTFKRSNPRQAASLAARTEVGGKYGRSTLRHITRHVPWLLMLNGHAPSTTKSKYRALSELGLVRQVVVRNRRRVLTIEFHGKVKIELCVDRLKAAGKGGTTGFMELEGEYVSGDAALLPEFDAYLRSQLPWLRSSRISKYERCLKSLKLWKRNRTVAAEDLKQWERRLQKVYTRFNTKYRRMLQFRQVEDLHACRVALRQMLTMLAVLGDDHKQPLQLRKLKRTFGKIQKILGRLRDWDVYMIYASVEPVLQLDTDELQKEYLRILELERDRQRFEATLRLPKYYNAELKRTWL